MGCDYDIQEIDEGLYLAVLQEEIHLHHAQSLGELILDGQHKPFRALACPLKPAAVSYTHLTLPTILRV